MGAHGIIVALLLFMIFGGALKGELAKGLSYLWPALPWLAGLYIIAGPAGGAISGFFRWLEKVGAWIAALLYGIGFIVFVVPVMVADTFLLGPLAMFAWKHMEVQILLVIASGFGYWYVTTTPVTVPKIYLTWAIVVGVASIVLGYASQFVLNTTWVAFMEKNGVFYAEPAESVEVAGGDHISFVGFGYAKGAFVEKGRAYVKLFPPEGDVTELYVADPSDRRGKPRGQMELVVWRPDGAKTSVPVRNIQVGPKTIFGILDFHKMGRGGYYISGEAEIPKGWAQGRLGLQVFAVKPTAGEFRLTLMVNPGSTGLVGLANRFLLLKGADPNLTGKETRVLLRFALLFVVGSIMIGGGVAGWRSQEGLLFYIPTILVSAAVVVGVLYAIEWFAYEGGGLWTLWEGILKIVRR